jgi:hypothetical protein
MALWSVEVVVEVKQRWSVIVWVTKNLLPRLPPCFGRHKRPYCWGPGLPSGFPQGKRAIAHHACPVLIGGF